MVEVFKTNVQEFSESKTIIQHLLAYFPECKVNFDLEDCDKILRVEHGAVPYTKIITLLHTLGYQCELL